MLFQYTKKFTLLRWVRTLSISFLLAMASVSFAQPTADEHAAHHPGEKEKEGEGMSGMMKNIGTRVWGAMEQPTDLRTILVF